MTWLLVLGAWTGCAVVAAPVVGRFLAHDDSPSPGRPALPAPRSPLPLS